MRKVSKSQLDYDLKFVTVKCKSLDVGLKKKDIELKQKQLELNELEQHNQRWLKVHEIIRTVAIVFGALAALAFTLIRIS